MFFKKLFKEWIFVFIARDAYSKNRDLNLSLPQKCWDTSVRGLRLRWPLLYSGEDPLFLLKTL